MDLAFQYLEQHNVCTEAGRVFLGCCLFFFLKENMGKPGRTRVLFGEFKGFCSKDLCDILGAVWFYMRLVCWIWVMFVLWPCLFRLLIVVLV